MVVGGGVSGVQAALDAANCGFKVYLVDAESAIGGKMAQLDKTFPTNDCSMCILSPKLLECAQNPNISILTLTRVMKVEGEAGDFKVTLVREPRYVDEDKCTGCGLCVEYCPVNILDAYNENLTTAKCISYRFPQAVPMVPVLHPDQCLFFLRQECKICAPVCEARAVDPYQKEERLEIEVGSIICAIGYQVFDPLKQDEYGYKRLSNVVTSLEFERILSASGPFSGELMRPSDMRPPKKMAWVQCVGSRDTTAGNGYCSGVCCMYAIKQAILSKEHDGKIEATIFHNDIRAFGKGFERYYERAKALGVRFIWSKVSIMDELPETKNVAIRYRTNGREIKDEDFDLAILSVGLTPSSYAGEVAGNLGIDVDHYGFFRNQGLSPMESSRPGVYLSGVCQAPKDIPDSVTMASGAASLSSQLLSPARGTLTTEKEYPPERDVSGEEPRIGVFVCHCGTNIATVVNVSEVAKYAEKLDNVVHAEDSTFACSVDSINHIVEVLEEKNLNRVVLAACTPRTHEPVFQEGLKNAGLNPFLLEMANIREQCSWMHTDKVIATQKARELVEMAVAKARLLRPLSQWSYDINRDALVIGGGISGMVSALSLAEQGFRVYLVEKTDELGGMARRIYNTLEGEDVQAYLLELIQKVYRNISIQVYTNTKVTEVSGYVGNFSTKIAVGYEERVKEIAHGVIIVASGAEEFKPAEYLYEKDSRVLTLLELEAEIAQGKQRLKSCNTLVMLLCVGSREEERLYCSRVCCVQAIKNALKLKDVNPEMEIYVLYRDMRTYGLKEDYYQEAAEKGVKFIRYEPESKPSVELVQEGGQDILRVSVVDPVLDQKLALDADILALGVAIVPPTDSVELSRALKVPLNEDGFFLEAHMKLRPVDFASDGVFMCGLAHGPKFIEESVAQAEAAACRAATILTKDKILAGGIVCSVDEEKCSGCGICQTICPYGAIIVGGDGEEKVAQVNEALCRGCGTCAAACPSGACHARGFEAQQIMAQIGVVAGVA